MDHFVLRNRNIIGFRYRGYIHQCLHYFIRDLYSSVFGKTSALNHYYFYLFDQIISSYSPSSSLSLRISRLEYSLYFLANFSINTCAHVHSSVRYWDLRFFNSLLRLPANCHYLPQSIVASNLYSFDLLKYFYPNRQIIQAEAQDILSFSFLIFIP